MIEPLSIDDVSANIPPHNYSKWALKARLGAFAAEQGEKLREKANGRQVEVDLPVTIVPAQPRGRTWSPEILQSQSHESSETAVTRAPAPAPPLPATSNVGPSNGRTIPAPSSNLRVDLNASSNQDPSSQDQQDARGSNNGMRIRFTPETWQRPTARQPDSENGRSSHPLSLVTSLGKEQRDDNETSAQPPSGSVPPPGNS